MFDELNNDTTSDDMEGLFKLFFVSLIGISLFSCIVLYYISH